MKSRKEKLSVTHFAIWVSIFILGLGGGALLIMIPVTAKDVSTLGIIASTLAMISCIAVVLFVCVAWLVGITIYLTKIWKNKGERIPRRVIAP